MVNALPLFAMTPETLQKTFDAQVAIHVAAERERCAKLCEDMADRHVVTEVSKRDALREAAAAIRKRE